MRIVDELDGRSDRSGRSSAGLWESSIKVDCSQVPVDEGVMIVEERHA